MAGMIFLLLLALISLNPFAAIAFSPQYEIHATFHEAIHQLEGTIKITFVNDSADPLSEIYLLLYPNLYSEKDTKINKTYYQRAYPVQFNPGSIQMTSVIDRHGNTVPFDLNTTKNKTVMKMRLASPVLPQGHIEFSIQFRTAIPEKHGVFGYYRDLAVLQGGWHPHLAAWIDGKWNLLRPPLPAHYRVRLTLHKEIKVMASLPSTQESHDGDEMSLLYEGELPFFSLAFGQNVVQLTLQIDRVKFNYHTREENQKYAEQVIREVKEATAYFLEQMGPLPETQLQISEAYLHQDLTSVGYRMFYISPAIFKILPSLKRFHEANIANGIFALLWRERIPHEENWVIEGLAERTGAAFMAQRYGGDASLGQRLKPFAFIPFIDDILYSKNIPLRQVYFKESIPPYLNEEFLFFMRPRPEGITFFRKLTNLLGKATVDEIVSSYQKALTSNTAVPFREVAIKVSGVNLDWFFDQWLESNPSLDFGIERIDRKKNETGHQTSLVVRKYGEGIEPVEILANEENGERTRLLWDGKGDRYEHILHTASRVKMVEVDPDHQSSDPNRINNQTPQAWKILLNRIKVSHDVNTGQTSYSAGILYQPVHDKSKQFGLTVSRADPWDTTRLEYSRLLKTRHTLTGGVSYLGTRTLPNQPIEAAAGIVHFSYTLSYPDIPFLSYYIEKLTGRYPNVKLTYEINRQITGDKDDSLFINKIDMRRNFVFSNYHEVATRFFAGQAFGKLFENDRFFLGGDGGIRGYTPFELEGDNIGFFSLEYRFPIQYERGYYINGVALTHTLQGVVFGDAGEVTDSRNIFHFSRYKSDIGMGIRWYLDMFGFYPTVLRLDAASPLPWQGIGKFLYYVSFGQPF